MVWVDGINLLPEACGEAGEAVIKLSLTGTGSSLPAALQTCNPRFPPCMEEVSRNGCIGKRRMDGSIALVKNTATLAFPYLTPRAGLLPEKTHLPPHLFHVK